MSGSDTSIAWHRALVPSAATLLFVMLSASGTLADGFKVHNTYGSPLDTIKNTRLTTTVPEAKDFVRETSPNRDKLDYTPLIGKDPDRPKPRDPKGIEALQAELEGAGTRNEMKAKGMLPRKATSRKTSAAKASVIAATR